MTTLSRRHLVTSAAALPALAVPALAAEAEHDPVIAMVENCRAAYAGLGQVCKREPVDAAGRLAKGPVHDQWKDEQAEVADEYEELEAAMLATAPRTKAGAAAMVRYHLDVYDDLIAEEGQLLTSLLSYLDAVKS